MVLCNKIAEGLDTRYIGEARRLELFVFAPIPSEFFKLRFCSYGSQHNNRFRICYAELTLNISYYKKIEVFLLINKRIQITKNEHTVFIFYLHADEVTCFSLNIKHSPNKDDLKYKELWLKLINEILK